LTSRQSGQQRKRCGLRVLLTGCLLSLSGGNLAGWAQPASAGIIHAGTILDTVAANSEEKQPPPDSRHDASAQWLGLPVRRIAFEGVPAERLTPLADHLAQATGAPLTEENLAKSLRELYATGLYESIEAAGVREGDGIGLIFKGAPRLFIGTVTVDGAKGATMNAQLERASRLTAGTRFSQARVDHAVDLMNQTLADNGFHQPAITSHVTPHPEQQLDDISFLVVSGQQARMGAVDVTGDPGMSTASFRRYAHLKLGERVDHDTVNRALAGVLKHYQKLDRLEAEIKLESQSYSSKTNKSSLHFSANQGPIVKVQIEGASMEQDDMKRLVPIFEEGSVDEDLLNEGNRRLRDYFQREGYFDAKVEHQRLTPAPNEVRIVYTVALGERRRVQRVAVSGNHYFDSATLKDLLSVHAADMTDRHGLYSQALLAGDVSALETVYKNNGFPKVRITPEVSTPGTGNGQAGAPKARSAGLAIDYHIQEGEQQRVGTVTLDGNDHVPSAKLTPLLNTAPGQLLSQQNLAGDRDALRTDYLNQGFDQARVDVDEQPAKADAQTIDVVFHIAEGPQIFVRNVLVSGLHYTRPDTVAKAIALKPGEPLNQTGLLETQRNLYDYALFNEVNTAVQNPNGDETHKTVLVQLTEARRWTLTYGLGFETQTGTPQNNCRGATANGVICNPNGKTGISPRVLLDITRNDLFGRDQSASIQGTYGLLEQKVNFVYQYPHFLDNRNFGLTFTGGYANSQDVTTYVASKLDAGLRVTENLNTPGAGRSRANQFIYEFDFRRVKVSGDSLQVGEPEIAELAAAVRVAGPGATWIRDTRDSALDSHRGTYTSFQEFVSNHGFGSQTQFNRLDMSNSSYYGFDKNKFVLARNSRYAQERAYGPASDELIPLPERIYAGGPTSLRGFSINAAGPRDAYTGFPIGGPGALLNSTELRLPPPTLPWLGDSVSFVLFEDMGNVFRNAGDAWASALRVRQPNIRTCKTLVTNSLSDYKPSQPSTSIGPQGECSFNYFSHAPGLGMRYHTPVGPIRLDFSYNLNPPYYPIYEDYSHPTLAPYIGHAGHFNFFFSLGQTF
jgi:outer membrane protein insertion porin family